MLKLRMKPSILCCKGDQLIRYHIANNMIILFVKKIRMEDSKVCAMSLGGVQSDILGLVGCKWIHNGIYGVANILILGSVQKQGIL